MKWSFEELENLLRDTGNFDLLHRGMWGLEKEFLRVDKAGQLALTPHPEVFGDKLTNPLITTDYSESQVEIVTPPMKGVEKVFEYLEASQSKASEDLGSEYIWPMSMPCRLPAESKIPIAKYGESEEGQAKEAYREHLSRQYGKKIQLICGIHYNFSLSDDLFELLAHHFDYAGDLQNFKNEIYFAIGRNFLRYKWLFIYLFGASPVVDKSYEPQFIKKMELFGECCSPCQKKESYYLEYATSLRMSRLGYSNVLRGEVAASYNSLPSYVRDIRSAIDKKSLINASEYYSLIRFKQDMKEGEDILSALGERGVNHLEIRALDLNPFLPTGTSLSRLYFCEILMIFCLFDGNELLSDAEKENTLKNHEKVSLSGRIPDLELTNNDGQKITLENWADEIFTKLSKIADFLDGEGESKKYAWVLERQRRKIREKSRLPSARILAEMEDNCENFIDFGVRMMEYHKLNNDPLDD